jgi:predicted polyphosphate/ATP-dependent NAD kinase
VPRKTLGLIVNPIAGMGGKVGLKGTDGAAILDEARKRGATPVAALRATRALKRLLSLRGEIDLITCPGAMGGDVAAALGLSAILIAGTSGRDTGPDDTQSAAAAMRRRGVDLLLFAGGDGTARDIHGIVGADIPLLGIPTGVKMHSAVFATSPGNAGDIAAAFLDGSRPNPPLRDAEIMDVDEAAMREGRLSARLYGYARVPAERNLVQSAKAGALASDDEALDALAGEIAVAMEAGRLYVLGPGTTVQRIKTRLGGGTLLGIDAALDGRLIGTDLNEAQLLSLLDGRKATIIVGVIGGQGYVFGRGNQPISAEVIRRAGLDNIVIIGGLAKLLALDPPCLRVDTGEEAIDRMLAGHRRVRIGPQQAMIFKVIT